jgi:hypothetical protein
MKRWGFATLYTHTCTHTHTQRERERERDRQTYTHTHTHTHTHAHICVWKYIHTYIYTYVWIHPKQNPTPPQPPRHYSRTIRRLPIQTPWNQLLRRRSFERFFSSFVGLRRRRRRRVRVQRGGRAEDVLRQAFDHTGGGGGHIFLTSQCPSKFPI